MYILYTYIYYLSIVTGNVQGHMAVFRYARNMAISMAKTVQEERLRWVLPIAEKRIKLVDSAMICPHGQRSMERWVAAYKEHGAEGLIPKSTTPHTHPEETPIHIKEAVIALRKEKKLCALKLHWLLQRTGTDVPIRTVGKILKQEGLVRKYRTKKITYKYIRAERQPGDLVEIDVKYVPGRIANKRYFQYTAIDCASRWRHLAVYDEQSNSNSIRFLREVIGRFPYPIKAIKTDNGTVFTNRYTGTFHRSDCTVKTVHALDRFCAERDIIHYLIDPGKPAQNGTVERSHRSDQETFYNDATFASFEDLRKRIRVWNTEYNDLLHCGLQGKSPNEFINEFRHAKPPNVLA